MRTITPPTLWYDFDMLMDISSAVRLAFRAQRRLVHTCRMQTHSRYGLPAFGRSAGHGVRLKKSALLPCPTKKDVPERSVRHVLRVLSCSAFNLSRSGYHRAVLGRVKVMWKPLSPKNSAVISGLRIWGSPMSLSICQGVRSLPRVADRSFMSSSGKVPQVART